MNKITRYASTNRLYANINDLAPTASIAPRYERGLIIGLIASAVAVVSLLGSMALASGSGQQEHKYCNPKVSKPCGNGCILLAKACHIPWTTSLSGIRPKVSTNAVSPQYVESAPQ